MSFAVKTNLTIVVQEVEGDMVLPWQKGLLCEDSAAHLGGGTVPSGSVKLPVVFPGVTTLTTLLFAPDVTMEVHWGDGAPSQTVEGGGLIGFSKGAMPAATALALTYTDTEGKPGAFCLCWGGH